MFFEFCQVYIFMFYFFFSKWGITIAIFRNASVVKDVVCLLILIQVYVCIWNIWEHDIKIIGSGPPLQLQDKCFINFQVQRWGFRPPDLLDI